MSVTGGLMRLKTRINCMLNRRIHPELFQTTLIIETCSQPQTASCATPSLSLRRVMRRAIFLQKAPQSTRFRGVGTKRIHHDYDQAFWPTSELKIILGYDHIPFLRLHCYRNTACTLAQTSTISGSLAHSSPVMV